MKATKKAITIFIVMILGLIITLPVMADGIRGNGNVVEQKRDIEQFHCIKVNGAFTIYLIQSDNYSLKVVADENLQSVIKSRVKGETLTITTEKSIYKSKELKLYIGFKHLESLKANGAIKLKSKHPLRFDELDIEINGASSANLELSAHCLNIDNSGASSIVLKGKADELNVDISGAGSVNALEMITREAKIDISGVGSGKVYVEEYLRVNISGIGSVKYKGDPQITSDISFLGSLKKY